MNNIRTLSVTFTEEIYPDSLASFRDAIIEKVGSDQINKEIWMSDAPGCYPLIQYQLDRRRPKLLFLNAAIGEARHFFSQFDWDFDLDGQHYHTEIAAIKTAQPIIDHTPGQWHYYRLRRWLALNSIDHTIYQGLPVLSERIVFLEKVLGNQILEMAAGLGYPLSDAIALNFTELTRTHHIYHEGEQRMMFDLSFRTDVDLPFGPGIGHNAALGFGRVWNQSESDFLTIENQKYANRYAG